MALKDIILGLLKERSMTGYELKQVFDHSMGFFSGASFGSIYPALRSLSRDGLLAMTVEPQEGGRPARKVYSLTSEGRKRLKEALSEPLGMAPYRNDFLIRLFLSGHQSKKERRRLAEDYVSHLEGRLEALDSIDGEIRENADPYQLLCHRFGHRLLIDLLENARQTAKELAEIDAGAGSGKPGADRKRSK